ncbi:MAG: alkene reductase, partial [Verrucomicrobiota bacterium]
VRPERPFVTPRALTLEEIEQTIEDYRQGAQNAKEAGFDGVELHGANGYLLDQFLQTSTNQRTDEYGGPIENRALLLLAATDAAISVWGPGKVGVHLAPACDAHDMGDADPVSTFTYVAKELGKRNIAFICAREGKTENSLGPKLKGAFGGNYIVNQGYTKESGNAAIASGEASAVAYGVLSIANPDLVDRFKQDAPLNQPNPDTFYSEGPKGYTDYPFLEVEQGSSK